MSFRCATIANGLTIFFFFSLECVLFFLLRNTPITKLLIEYVYLCEENQVELHLRKKKLKTPRISDLRKVQKYET